MAKDRQDYEELQGSLGGRTGVDTVTMETLRSVAAGHPPEAHKGEERLSVFWRVFGGTLLSIGALIVITICNQFNSSLTDLRKEMNQLYEIRAELLRKDEFNNRMSSVWGGIKELQSAGQSLPALNEKTKVMDLQMERQARNTEEDRKEFARRLEEQRKSFDEERKDLQRKLDDQRKASEEDRKDLHRQLQSLTERLAKVEGRQASKGSSMPKN